jgi:hypothetical protein
MPLNWKLNLLFGSMMLWTVSTSLRMLLPNGTRGYASAGSNSTPDRIDMATPEAAVKVRIKRVLDELGIWYFMPAANGFGKVGIPDFICCWQGEFLAIEAKAPGKLDNLTPNQFRRIEEIRSAGGMAFVVDDAEHLRRSLTALPEGVLVHGRR